VLTLYVHNMNDIKGDDSKISVSNIFLAHLRFKITFSPSIFRELEIYFMTFF